MDTDETDFVDDADILQGNEGNPRDDRDNIIENLYNTENRIKLLKVSWYGLASMSFINKQIAALRAIINTTNAFTRKTSEECQNILFRSVQAFILDMVKESDEDLPKKHYRTMAKTYEHALELFLGLPEGGHGARVLKEALAGISTPEPVEKKPSMKDWLTSR